MLRKKKGQVEWLEFELLAAYSDIKHGVFLRHGGTSSETFSSLNVLRERGDDTAQVEENRRRIAEALGINIIVSGYQVHGTEIIHLDGAENKLLTCDGLLTNQKNFGLMAIHADCQAALFYDPVHQAIATVHAGWRGQVHNIYRHMIEKLQKTFQTCPQDLLVCISPSLGPQNSEFKHFRTELPENFWQFQVKPTYFDLWALSQHQLEECGVLPEHIQIAKMDTYENSTDFFSYRREKAKGRQENITGGHGTVIALRT